MTAPPKNVFEWSQAYFRNEDRELHKTRSVMAALMTYADFNQLTCYPRQQTLAKDTGLSVDSVQRHLKANVEAGWLKVLVRGTSKTSSSRYRLAIPANYPQQCGQSEPANYPQHCGELEDSPQDCGELAAALRSTGRSTAALTNQGTNQRTTYEQQQTGPLEGPVLDDDASSSSSPSSETNHLTSRSTAASCGDPDAPPRRQPWEEMPFGSDEPDESDGLDDPNDPFGNSYLPRSQGAITQ